MLLKMKLFSVNWVIPVVLQILIQWNAIFKSAIEAYLINEFCFDKSILIIKLTTSFTFLRKIIYMTGGRKEINNL